MSNKSKLTNTKQSARNLAIVLAGFSPCLLALDSTPLNNTKRNMSTQILSACAQETSTDVNATQINSGLFQRRCNALVGSGGGGGSFISTVNNSFSQDGDISPLANAINRIAPEQLITSGVQATRTMGNVASIATTAISSRLTTLRTASYNASTTQLAKALVNSGKYSFSFNPDVRGGAAGIADTGRLGIWGNGTFNTGDVDSSTNQLGFDFDTWGGTIGADYRVSNDLVAGLAFTYLNTDADVTNSSGNVESDSYTGTVYATYSHESGFYVDGMASYGSIDFDISRNIVYNVNTNGADGIVNGTAKGDPSGAQYSFGMGIGYQFSVASASIEPYARADYLEYEIDSYSESGATGWEARFGKQRVRSLPTTVGLRLSNAFSLPWGVLLPQIHGAWHHQFKDDKRRINAGFLGDGALLGKGPINRFNIVTEGPDRDYYTVGASVTATLANGITAFVAYNTLLGYRDIDSHRVTFGGRLEF